MTCSLLNGVYHVHQISGGEREGDKVWCFWNSVNCRLCLGESVCDEKVTVLMWPRWKINKTFLHFLDTSTYTCQAGYIYSLGQTRSHPFPFLFITYSFFCPWETLPHSRGCGWGWVDSTQRERNRADLGTGHERQLFVQPPAHRKWRELHWKQSISSQGQKFGADFEKPSGLQKWTQNGLPFPRSLMQQIEKSYVL